MNEKQLRELFATKSKEVDTLLGKGQELTGEDFLQVKKLNTEIEDLSGQIEECQKNGNELLAIKEANAKRLATLNTPVLPIPVPGTPAVPNVLGMQKSGEAELIQKDGVYQVLESQHKMTRKQAEMICSKEYEEAFQAYLAAGSEQKMRSATQVKTLMEGSDTAGGYTVPEAVLARLIQKKPAPTRLAAKVQRLTTGRDNLNIPRTIWNTDDLYTTGIRVTWTGEVPSSATVHRATDPVFGSMRIPIFTAMLSSAITQDIIEDSMFGLTEYLAMKFTETRDLLHENMILNGNGINQPTGILLNPISGTGDTPQYKTLGNPVTADNIVAMAYSVPEQYDEGLTWVFNKTNMGAYLAGLKDADNRYLWGSSFQGINEGTLKASLLGYPVTLSSFMPDRGANNYPMLLGDLRGYALIERVGLSIQVLNEVYAEVNQKVLLGRLRLGGDVIEPWRMKVGKQA